jgi:thymidylate synthase ThyX
MHINVVATATDYNNFFALRRHKDAQPEIHLLADCMWDALQTSKPKRIKEGEWHLPYVTNDDWEKAVLCYRMRAVDNLVKVSVARCARVSYLTHEQKVPTFEEDLTLYDRLVGNHPMHASPAEHQATPDHWQITGMGDIGWSNPKKHGNLTGFIQYRKTLSNENIVDYVPDTN